MPHTFGSLTALALSCPIYDQTNLDPYYTAPLTIRRIDGFEYLVSQHGPNAGQIVNADGTLRTIPLPPLGSITNTPNPTQASPAAPTATITLDTTGTAPAVDATATPTTTAVPANSAPPPSPWDMVATTLGTEPRFVDTGGVLAAGVAQFAMAKKPIANAETTNFGDGDTETPILMTPIFDYIMERTGNWPRRVGRSLFIDVKAASRDRKKGADPANASEPAPLNPAPDTIGQGGGDQPLAGNAAESSSTSPPPAVAEPEVPAFQWPTAPAVAEPAPVVDFWSSGEGPVGSRNWISARPRPPPSPPLSPARSRTKLNS